MRDTASETPSSVPVEFFSMAKVKPLGAVVRVTGPRDH